MNQWQQDPFGPNPYSQRPGGYGQPQPDPWAGSQPQFNPYAQQQPLPPGRPPRRRRPHRGLRIFAFSSVGFLFLVILLVAIGAKGNKGTTGAAASSSAASAPAAQSQAAVPPAQTTAAAAAATTVATFSGSGTETTATFTVGDTWKLDYSFNCSAFGSQGNFQVFEDGGSDLNGVEVNVLSTGQNGSTMAYGDGGTHYLEVNSECSWKVSVIDEG